MLNKKLSNFKTSVRIWLWHQSKDFWAVDTPLQEGGIHVNFINRLGLKELVHADIQYNWDPAKVLEASKITKGWVSYDLRTIKSRRILKSLINSLTEDYKCKWYFHICADNFLHISKRNNFKDARRALNLC